MNLELLRRIYRIGSATWIFLSGLLLTQGITVIDSVTLASQWPRVANRTLVQGFGYIVLSAACATLSWELSRIEGEVSLIAHTGIGIADLSTPISRRSAAITEAQRLEAMTDSLSDRTDDSRSI